LAASPTALRAAVDRVYDVHGIRFRVESDDTTALATVATTYAAFAIPPDSVGPGVRVVQGAPARRGPATGDAAVLDLLDRVVDEVLEGLAARGVLVMHAGAVELDGRAFVLAGHSGAGKSTLTLGLVRGGAGWLTDELTLIDRDDRTVLPYPRAIHVSPDTVRLLPTLDFLTDRPRQTLGGDSEWSLDPEDVARGLGGRLAPPTPLGGILLMHRRPEPDRPPRLEPIPPGVATMELLRHTPAAARDMGGVMRRLAGIVPTVPTMSLRAGPLEETVIAIQRWAAGST
jgi:hypothetical protein